MLVLVTRGAGYSFALKMIKAYYLLSVQELLAEPRWKQCELP